MGTVADGDTAPHLGKLLPFVDAVVLVDTCQAGVLQNKDNITVAKDHSNKV